MQKIAYGGMDLGGTSLKFGLVSVHGELIFSSKKKTGFNKSKESIVEMILSTITELQKQADKNHYVIQGIGLGTPGQVDIYKGMILGKTPNFQEWGEVSLKNEVAQHFSLPFYVDNDANLAAYGEYEVILKEKYKNIIYVTIGTGIGGGIILDGKIYRGAHFSGSEIGHMSIDYEGIPCNCGRSGCWEQYASSTALVRFYNLRSQKPIAGAYEFFTQLEKGDSLAVKIVNEFYNYISVGLANLINIFDPECVIIGGGISESSRFDIGNIKDLTMNKVMIQNPIEFRKAGLGNKAGIIGAAKFAQFMVTNKTKIS